jgi:hypothetical protein
LAQRLDCDCLPRFRKKPLTHLDKPNPPLTAALFAARRMDTTEIERKVTAPDSNRKIIEELKKYALEHEARYGRFPKTLIFAANDDAAEMDCICACEFYTRARRYRPPVLSTGKLPKWIALRM